MCRIACVACARVCAHRLQRKYEFIHPSRREELEQKIIQLQRVARDQMDKQHREAKQQAAQSHGSQHTDGHHRRASLAELDSYLELLYEGTKENQTPKIQATANLLELCEDVQALEELVKNGPVMSALTRVLKEEHKNSTELSFNILRIFLAFSNFLELHSILTKHHVGKDTIEVWRFRFSVCWTAHQGLTFSYHCHVPHRIRNIVGGRSSSLRSIESRCEKPTCRQSSPNTKSSCEAGRCPLRNTSRRKLTNSGSTSDRSNGETSCCSWPSVC